MIIEKLLKELSFKGIRSSGAGGQHVNKVASKIELTFDLQNSAEFSVAEKQLLINNLTLKLTKNNVLILQCDESRSQHKNKKIVIERFIQIIKKGLTVPKKRTQTRPTKTSIEKRLERKKKNAFKKAFRRKPEL